MLAGASPQCSPSAWQVDALAAYLEAKGVTEMLFTPSLLETLLASVEKGTLQALPLQVVWLNGEVTTPFS